MRPVGECGRKGMEPVEEGRGWDVGPRSAIHRRDPALRTRTILVGTGQSKLFLEPTLQVLHPVRTFGLLARFLRAKAWEAPLELTDGCLSRSPPGIEPGRRKARLTSISCSGTGTYSGTSEWEGMGIMKGPA